MESEADEDFGLLDEKSVLGAVLLSQDAMDDVSLILEEDDFRQWTHRKIYRAAHKLREQRKPVSPTTVAEWLQQDGSLTEVGLPYLVDLMEANYATSHASYHAKQVRKRSTIRQFKSLGLSFGDLADDMSREPSEIFGIAEQELHAIIEKSLGKQDEIDIGSILQTAFSDMSKLRDVGVKSGFTALDAMTLGFQKGHLILVGARPSVGKTAFACNLALGCANNGASVLFVSLEQSRLQLADRLLAIESRLDSNAIRCGGLNEPERMMLLSACSRLQNLKLFIDDTPGQTVTQLAAKIRLMRRRNKLGLVIIDYLQIIAPEDRKVSREQQVATISSRLLILARELEIPIILLVQLNRKSHDSKDGTPQLFHLRESGALEQDANVVILLNRPHLTDPLKYPKSQAVAIVAKNRDGKTGDVPMRYLPPTLTFQECDRRDWDTDMAISPFEREDAFTGPTEF